MMPLDFEVLREEWNILELEDNTVLRLRPILLFVVPGQEKAAGGYQLRINTQIGVWAESKGKPVTEPVTQELIRKNVDQANLKFRFLDRGTSVYRIEDGAELQLVFTPSQVDRTSMFDSDGEPIYSINHELQIMIKRREDEG